MTGNAATSPTSLLELAQAVLGGTHPIPIAQTPRAAALLARQALEELIDELCVAVGAPLRRATTRSRLVSLRILADDGVASIAATAWAGLSRACHQHAYELTPTVGEIRHLIDLVAALIARTGTGIGRSEGE